ncbi:MAG: acyl-ACP--UDP-N-acetylglucosamine O-acyltransferase [Halanaerobiales bacterium]|nr:acyl-ACP--UDP-N-acetylglucosamine O-acyltransferase [Halanaerobiales bacterium]
MLSNNKIDHTAIISDSVKLGNNVEVGPYTIITEEVEIGDNTKIGAYCHLQGWTKIGDNNLIDNHVTIGFPPQNIGYDGSRTFVNIGDNNKIREYATIHRGTTEGRGETKIGDNNTFKLYSHVAHDCYLGNNIILDNYVNLAGHVVIYNDAYIERMVGVHQFVKIGNLSLIEAHSKLIKDVPPYIVVNGHPAQVAGINEVGLNDKNVDTDVREEIRKAYNILYESNLNISQAIEKLEKVSKTYEQIKNFINFLKNSNRGICR